MKNITAIIIALNEEQFVDICISAIYDFVQRIVVVTNYDTDYSGKIVSPDSTVSKILSFKDTGRKIVLIAYRDIKDEVIQRNWAMSADLELSKVAGSRILPHEYPFDEIKKSYPKTEYFWIIDADEIYDPETIPGIIDFVYKSNSDAVAIRGFNHFQKWNYRISPKTDYFSQIGFLRAGKTFWARRVLYHPRVLGWAHHINPWLSQKLIALYKNQIALPERIGVFYHGSYVGDTERIKKKMFSSSHLREIGKDAAEAWIRDVWEGWTPESKNFFFKNKPGAFSEVEVIPTSSLPKVIKNALWPADWILPD